MNLIDKSSGADLSFYRDASFPIVDIVMENSEDGIPGTVKVHRESQVICVHIPMNCLSDKLTILLYGNPAKKLH